MQKQKDNQQEKHWQQIIKFWFVPVLHFFKKHRQPIEKFSWIPVPVRETVRKKKRFEYPQQSNTVAVCCLGLDHSIASACRAIAET